MRSVELLFKARDEASAAVKAVTTALKSENDAVAYAKKLYQESLPLQERMARGQEYLTKALTAGKISVVEYNHALDDLKRKYKEVETAATSFARLASANVASPVTMNMGRLAASGAGANALLAGMRPGDPVFNQSAGGMNMSRLGSLGRDGRWDAGMSRMRGAAADQASAAGAQAESQTAYLARVRYNSHKMEREAASAARAERSEMWQGRRDRFFGGTRGMLGGMLPVIGAGAAVAGSWNAFLEQDTAEARLKGVMRATGGGSGQTMSGLRDFAAARQAKTTFGDEQTLGSAAVLSTFQHIKGDQFTKTLIAAQDLATVMGTDLESATRMLGKAMEDPEEQMKTLARAGIILSDSAKEEIKARAAAGDSVKAHTLLLEEISARVGGAAEVAGQSASGQWAQLKNALSDVGELLGAKLVPAVQWLAEQLKGLTPPTPGSEQKNQQGAIGNALGVAENAGSSSANIERELKDIDQRRSKLMDEAAAIRAQMQDEDTLFSGIPFIRQITGSIKGLNLGAQHEEKMGAVERLNDAGSILTRRLRSEKAADAERTKGGGSAMARAFGLPGIGEGLSAAGDFLGNQFQTQYEGGVGKRARYSLQPAGELGGLIGYGKNLLAGAKPGIKQMLEENKDFLSFRDKYRSPASARDDAMAEFEKFKHMLSAPDQESALKKIQEEYDRDTKGPKEKKDRERDDDLRAVESRFLTRGSGGISPIVQEQKQTNKHLESMAHKIDASNRELKDIRRGSAQTLEESSLE